MHMAKYFFVAIIISISCLHLMGFKPQKTFDFKIDSVKNDTSFKIYKIDSFNLYYFIYAKKQDRLYKIVSRKELVSRIGTKSPCNNELKINGEYDLVIKSLLYKPLYDSNGKEVHRLASSHVRRCVALDASTRVCLEKSDSIWDIYESKSIRGLCLAND